MKTQLSLLLISIQSELLTLISICFAFFLPISGILLMIGVLIIIDTLTGIWKANKLKEKITSRKLSAIVSKLALYEVTVIMFFLIDKFILNDIILTFFSVNFMLTKVVALVLASIEVMSINENYKVISNKNLDLWQSMKLLFARAKDINDDIKKIKK
jgi:phage-related holin